MANKILPSVNSTHQKILLFDLDDTLIKIEGGYQHFDQIIIDVFHTMNVTPPSITERDKLWRNSNYVEQLKSWNFPDPVLFWQLFDKIDFEKRKKMHENLRIRIYDEILPTLTQIHAEPGIFCAIVTNTSEVIADYEIDLFNLRHFFGRIFALGDNQEECKPSLKGMKRVLDKLDPNGNIDKNNIFIIGDSSKDVEAGRNIGINTIYINRKGKDPNKLKIKPDYVFKDLSEILSLI